MGIRLVNLVNDEYYHVFNRGVEKRRIFDSKADSNRFLENLICFNTINLNSRSKNINETIEKNKNEPKLVEIVAYCLNPNHFHILLKQVSDKGIEKFIQKICTGYSTYYNVKNNRSGPLFSGRFKSVHIDSDNKLLKASAYINLNYVVHDIENSKDLDIVKSSWEEYIDKSDFNFCNKKIILDNFDDIDNYRDFCLNIIKSTKEVREKIDLDNESVIIE